MRTFSKIFSFVVLIFAVSPFLAFTVCIDAGHPSEVNSGTTLSNGLKEVTICWQVALLLKQKLLNAKIKVVMTKSSEMQYVTNKRRAEIANSAEADLMVRIHADAGNGSGFTTYYPRKQGTKFGTTGPTLSVIKQSENVAKIFHPAFAKNLKGELKDLGMHGDEKTFHGSKQGALTGSIFSKVPVLLVEICFLTNKKDADWIRQPKNREKMATALASGILAVRSSVQK